MRVPRTRAARLEMRVVSIMKHLRYRPRVLYDIGVGSKSEWMVLASQFTGLSLYGAEPRSTTFARLSPVFPGKLLNVAVGEPGEAQLWYSDRDDCSSLKRRNTPDTACEVVQVVSLDQFDQQCSPQATDILLWVDAEGSEEDILRSGPELMVSERVTAVVIEENLVSKGAGFSTFRGVHKLLDDYGFVRQRTLINQKAHRDALYFRKGRDQDAS